MPDHKLRIADIQTTELLYFDPDYAAECYKFCLNRDIDCLPSIDYLPAIDDQFAHFYLRNDETRGFDRFVINEDRRLIGSTYIFHPELIDRFRNEAVLFVYENGELSGVIHFVDYNKQSVSTYLYSLISEYERNLRRFAILSGLSNMDMGNYFQEMLNTADVNDRTTEFFQRRLNRYEDNEQQSMQKPSFQSFFLNDLIGMLIHKEILNLQIEVVSLRNSIMHADEMVSLVDTSAADFIFDFESFENFFFLVQSFLNDAARVRNRIVFLDGIEEMGRPP